MILHLPACEDMANNRGSHPEPFRELTLRACSGYGARCSVSADDAPLLPTRRCLLLLVERLTRSGQVIVSVHCLCICCCSEGNAGAPCLSSSDRQLEHTMVLAQSSSLGGHINLSVSRTVPATPIQPQAGQYGLAFCKLCWELGCVQACAYWR